MIESDVAHDFPVRIASVAQAAAGAPSGASATTPRSSDFLCVSLRESEGGIVIIKNNFKYI